MEIKYEDIQRANETIKPTDIKGKDYAEVNQRIKAFRMVYPQGCIQTHMVSNENGICVFRANITTENGVLLATGTAYEKENSTFINKTSYIENCETSAVGRALGMCGFGIDTSIASAEEVQNAMNNQEPTQEEAEQYQLTFGKHNGKTIRELPEEYIDWLIGKSDDEYLLKCIELITGKRKLTEEEQKQATDMQVELLKLMTELETKDEKWSRQDLYDYYDTTKLTIDQMKEAIAIVKKKLGGK